MIPRKIEVSAVDSKTNIEKAWFLHKIKSITIDHKPQPPLPAVPQPIAIKQEQGILNKATKVGKSAASMAVKAGQAVVSAVKKTGEYLSGESNAHADE